MRFLRTGVTAEPSAATTITPGSVSRKPTARLPATNDAGNLTATGMLVHPVSLRNDAIQLRISGRLVSSSSLASM